MLGDLFQQYAAKYVGIGRGIPLSNTNQLWGLAWGALVFGELGSKGSAVQAMVIAGSAVMVLGAAAISSAAAPKAEQASWRSAVERECERYGLNREQALNAQRGEDLLDKTCHGRRWWDLLIVSAALGTFLWLGAAAGRPPIPMRVDWAVALILATIVMLVGCGMLLWKRTGFS